MDTVTSKDGTRIAFWRSGTGPPLLLIHGMVADHSTTWRLVLPELEQHFTVCAMNGAAVVAARIVLPTTYNGRRRTWSQSSIPSVSP